MLRPILVSAFASLLACAQSDESRIEESRPFVAPRHARLAPEPSSYLLDLSNKLPRVPGRTLRDGLVLRVSSREVRVDDRSAALRWDDPTTETELLDAMLEKRLKREAMSGSAGDKNLPDILIAAERNVQARTLIQTLRASSAAGFSSFGLLVEPAPSRFALLPFRVAQMPPPFEGGDAVAGPGEIIPMQMVDLPDTRWVSLWSAPGFGADESPLLTIEVGVGSCSVSSGRDSTLAPQVVPACDLRALEEVVSGFVRERPGGHRVHLSVHGDVSLERLSEIVAQLHGAQCGAEDGTCRLPDLVIVASNAHRTTERDWGEGVPQWPDVAGGSLAQESDELALHRQERIRAAWRLAPGVFARCTQHRARRGPLRFTLEFSATGVATALARDEAGEDEGEYLRCVENAASKWDIAERSVEMKFDGYVAP